MSTVSHLVKTEYLWDYKSFALKCSILAWRANAIMEELFHCMTIEIKVVEAFTHISLDVTIPFTLIRCRQNRFQNFKNPFFLIFYISLVKFKVRYVSSRQLISLTHSYCQKFTETPGLLFWDLTFRLTSCHYFLSISLIFYSKCTQVYLHTHTYVCINILPCIKLPEIQYQFGIKRKYTRYGVFLSTWGLITRNSLHHRDSWE